MPKFVERIAYGPSNAIDHETRSLCDAFDAPHERVEILYRDLSVIDGKSASLLTFNSIGLAVLAVWLTGVPANGFHLSLDVVFLILLVSSALLLPAVRVFWSRAHQYRENEDHIRLLVRIREFRTRMYMLAWRFSMFSILLLTLLTVLHSGHTLQHVLGRCGTTCQHVEGAFGHVLR
jgi:hypothetical protein